MPENKKCPPPPQMALLIFTKNTPPPFYLKEFVRTKTLTVTYMCLKNHIKVHLFFYYFDNTFKKSVWTNILILKYGKEKHPLNDKKFTFEMSMR